MIFQYLYMLLKSLFDSIKSKLFSNKRDSTHTSRRNSSSQSAPGQVPENAGSKKKSLECSLSLCVLPKHTTGLIGETKCKDVTRNLFICAVAVTITFVNVWLATIAIIYSRNVPLKEEKTSACKTGASYDVEIGYEDIEIVENITTFFNGLEKRENDAKGWGINCQA